MTVDFEKQVVIMGIYLGIECLICHMLPEKSKNFYKVWPKQKHEYICVQFRRQDNIKRIEDNDFKHSDSRNLITNFALS